MSDRELQRAESLVDADDWTDDDIGDAACVLERCVAELRERRAADLTSEEMAATYWLRTHLALALERRETIARDQKVVALAVLDRLLDGGK